MHDVKIHHERSWWGQLYRGLVVDAEAKHYHRMRGAVWLFAYFVIHANRQDGSLKRKYETVARDMGLSVSTVRRWMGTLRKYCYVTVTHTGRSQVIHIQRWKSVAGRGKVAKN